MVPARITCAGAAFIAQYIGARLIQNVPCAEVCMQFEFYVPSRIIFGEGSLEELGKRTLPGKKAMLVTSRGGSAKRSGALDKVLSVLKACGEEPAIFNKPTATNLSLLTRRIQFYSDNKMLLFRLFVKFERDKGSNLSIPLIYLSLAARFTTNISL